MTTYTEARRAVERAADAVTLAQGYQDAEHYAVPLAHPPIDDTLWLVDKSTGVAARVVHWDIEAKLDAMVPVATP